KARGHRPRPQSKSDGTPTALVEPIWITTKEIKQMQSHRNRMFAIATVFAIAAVWTGGGVTANAQYISDNYYPATPSQGPLLASGNTYFTVDAFITPEVYGRIDRAIRDNNRCYNSIRSGAQSCLSPEPVDA